MRCPKCKTLMTWDGKVRTSIPPKYLHVCTNCGYTEFLDTSEEIDDLNLFDPDTLKPFDKVLVRKEEHQEWIPMLFAKIVDYNGSCVCIGDIHHDHVYENVIPYNEETACLAYEYNNPPLNYRYWDKYEEY